MVTRLRDTRYLFKLVKSSVFKGLHFVFSGVVDKNRTSEFGFNNDPHVRLALSFGAKVSQNLIEGVTHVVAAHRSEKVKQAYRLNIRVVHVTWLYHSMAHYAVGPETDFKIHPQSSLKSDHHLIGHRAQPPSVGYFQRAIQAQLRLQAGKPLIPTTNTMTTLAARVESSVDHVSPGSRQNKKQKIEGSGNLRDLYAEDWARAGAGSTTGSHRTDEISRVSVSGSESARGIYMNEEEEDAAGNDDNGGDDDGFSFEQEPEEQEDEEGDYDDDNMADEFDDLF